LGEPSGLKAEIISSRPAGELVRAVVVAEAVAVAVVVGEGEILEAIVYIYNN